MLRLSITTILVLFSTVVLARGVYQEPNDFINEVFNGAPPADSRIWLTNTVKDNASRILGHAPSVLRLRYWGREQRTAWILEEIGKEEPITVGIVINNNRIERIKVLVFRESRGWEVRHDFFTTQFNNAGLNADQQLDTRIDGISGATLSVRALTKVARLALYLHQQTPFAYDTP